MVQWGIELEFVTREPIFEKCSHLREKGGVLTLRTPIGFALTPTGATFMLMDNAEGVPDPPDG